MEVNLSFGPAEHASPSSVSGRSATYPIPTTDGISVDRGQEIILVRHAGRVYAFALSCPHQRSMLKWREKDQEFRCTKHGSKYRISGEYSSGRATRAMDRHGITRVGDQLEVDLTTKYKRDEQPDLWASAHVAL